MLSTTERIIFFVMVAIFGGITLWGFRAIFNLVRSGRAAPKLKNILGNVIKALIEVGMQKTLFRTRIVLSIFHAFIFFGFSYYLLVNLTDVLEGFVPGFELIYGGVLLAETYPVVEPLVDFGIINAYNLAADLFSILVLVGMVVFLLRRFLGNDKRLRFNKDVLLDRKVAKGSVFLDSAIVGGFIMIHVGSRFMGQVLRVVREGDADPFMPFASLTAKLFSGMTAADLDTSIHATWWLAIGLIVVFLPYFITSKHFHLIMAPLNLGLAKQTPRGELDPGLPKDSPADMQPGAMTLHDLSWPRLVDAYACIMCNRCNDVCPAHSQGWELSPAALEVNKRYLFNREISKFNSSDYRSETKLVGTVISPEAIWSCTACYACVQICPVGNEPMADIIDLRRRMLVNGEDFDSGIQNALESIAKNGNWFGKGKRRRAKWSKALDFKIKDVTSEHAEYLWFVGDTASFDERVIPKTQTVARVLKLAGVDYGILYKEEHNSGNDVRRAGEEGLFEQSVEENLAAFGKSNFSQILTTDPHSLNTLRNEYPQYGGKWTVSHYSQILVDLFETGKLEVKNKLSHYSATYHDPCYLGRYNGGYAAPRKLLDLLGIQWKEMPRNQENSFCCGAGGFQIAVSQTPEGERPAENRIREAVETLSATANGSAGHKQLFVVSCPKDVVMYTDAVKTTENEDKMEVRDIIDLVAEAIGLEELGSEAASEPEAVLA